jgi:hypothetical protein
MQHFLKLRTLTVSPMQRSAQPKLSGKTQFIGSVAHRIQQVWHFVRVIPVRAVLHLSVYRPRLRLRCWRGCAFGRRGGCRACKGEWGWPWGSLGNLVHLVPSSRGEFGGLCRGGFGGLCRGGSESWCRGGSRLGLGFGKEACLQAWQRGPMRVLYQTKAHVQGLRREDWMMPGVLSTAGNEITRSTLSFVHKACDGCEPTPELLAWPHKQPANSGCCSCRFRHAALLMQASLIVCLPQR